MSPEPEATPRVALVTGAAGGIGGVIVDRLLKDGFTVAAADLGFPGGGREDAHMFPFDLGDPGAVWEAVGRIRDRLGPVSVLVHAAAWQRMMPLDQLDADSWEQSFRVNVNGAFHLVKALLPDLRAAAYARIVFITSSSFHAPLPGMSHYIATKGALTGFAHGLATELGGDGVTVNAVAPGLTRTPVTLADMPEEGFAANAARQAIHRNGEPSDVAAAVSYLVSAEAAFVTGQTLLVDGGENFT